MKCVVKSKKGSDHLVWMDKALHRINKDEVLVRMMATAVCGTDVYIVDWDSWSETRVKAPVTIEHEFVGEVTNVKGKPGDSQRVGLFYMR